ncbi:MAG: S8 family serine peptidase [Acidobacteriota bacterium]
MTRRFRLAVVPVALAAAAAAATPPPAVVSPGISARVAAGAETLDCIVVLRSQAAAFGPAAAGVRVAVSERFTRTWEPLGVRVERRFDNLPVLRARVPAALLASVATDPSVRGLAPNRTARAFRKEGRNLMRVPEVINRGFTGAGIGIAVLDTGVDWSHKELYPGGTSPGAKTVPLFDAVERDDNPRDEDGHGTSVAGIAAGSTSGVATRATVVAVRVLDDDGEGTSEQILAGIDAVLDSVQGGNPFNIRVANLSLGGYDDDWLPGPDTCDAVSPDFAVAFEALRDAGVLVVASAGNGGCSKGVAWPACISHAMAVGAVYDDEICQLPAPPPFDCFSHEASYGEAQCMDDCSDDTDSDRIACYSDSGVKLDAWAPSTCAKTTALGGGTEECFGGTSAAAPYVSGVAALLAQAFPERGPEEIRAALRDTGRARTDKRNGITRNRVDAPAALARLATLCAAPPTPTALSASAACAGTPLTVSWPVSAGAVSYAVESAPVPDFTGATSVTVTGTTTAVSTTADAAFAYLRVRAHAACGADSAWSQPLAVPLDAGCSTPRRRLSRPR